MTPPGHREETEIPRDTYSGVSLFVTDGEPLCFKGRPPTLSLERGDGSRVRMWRDGNRPSTPSPETPGHTLEMNRPVGDRWTPSETDFRTTGVPCTNLESKKYSQWIVTHCLTGFVFLSFGIEKQYKTPVLKPSPNRPTKTNPHTPPESTQ